MKLVFIFLLTFIIGICISLLLINQSSKQNLQKQTAELPKDRFSIVNPPSQSIRGTILSLTGNVEFETRTATQPAILTEPTTIEQGEKLVTKGDGLSTLQIAKEVTISVLPKTQLEFVQTLPADIVIKQNEGTATYTKTGNYPLAIESMDLMLQQSNGEITVNADNNSDLITVTVKSGKVQAAFDDLQNKTNIVDINSGSSYIFDDDNRKGNLQISQ